MFSFKKERLKKDQSLGQGNSGEVLPYQKHPDDTKWVVKRIKARNVEDLLRFLPEIVWDFLVIILLLFLFLAIQSNVKTTNLRFI